MGLALGTFISLILSLYFILKNDSSGFTWFISVTILCIVFFSVISIFLSNSIIFAVNFYVLAFHYSPFFVVAHFSQFFDIYFAHYSLFYKPALHPLNLTCIISAFNNHKWNALNSSDVSFLLCVNKTFFVSSGIWIKLYKCQRLSLDNLNNLYASIYIFFGFHFFSKLTSSY